MRTAAPPAKPTLAPLRVVSDVLDAVEVDLESVQRDLVLAERVGVLVVAIGALALVGGIAFVVLRRSRAKHVVAPPVPDATWPPVPVSPSASGSGSGSGSTNP